MTIPSPWQVKSFARVKLSLTRIAQVPSRGANVGAGELAAVGDKPPPEGVPPGEDDPGAPGLVAAWQATAAITASTPSRATSGRMSQAYTAASRARFPQTRPVREEARRIAGRLEGTLRIPDVTPTAIVVIAHALPTHGGTMRTPIMAAIARAAAERGWYALRFNFRGVGESEGDWSGGRHEVEDLEAAVVYAREIAPGLPLALVGYSFGAFQVLAYLARGDQADAVALVGIGTKNIDQTPRALPPVPPGTFIVAAENDQFGTAAELRAALPDARIATVRGVDHFFVGKRDEVGALVAEDLARVLPVPSHLP
jgi:alpha/beta superfamily hydrolase